MTFEAQGVETRAAWRVALPCSLTLGCILSGFLAIALTADGRITTAVWFLYAAVVLDMLDGWVARAVRGTSEIGLQLDSLADIVAFGVAPAFVVYRGALADLGPAGLLAPALYLAAGALRLARYNVVSDAHAKESRIRGLPITVAAGYMMLLALLGDRLPDLVTIAALLILVGAMLSRFPLPTLAVGTGLRLMILFSLALFTVSVARPGAWTIGVWNLWNLVILIVAWTRSESA